MNFNKFLLLVENVDFAKEFLSDPKVIEELIRTKDFLNAFR